MKTIQQLYIEKVSRINVPVGTIGGVAYGALTGPEQDRFGRGVSGGVGGEVGGLLGSLGAYKLVGNRKLIPELALGAAGVALGAAGATALYTRAKDILTGRTRRQ